MTRRHQAGLADAASIAFVWLLLLGPCGACAARAALFVPPKAPPASGPPDETLAELARFPAPPCIDLAVAAISAHRAWLATYVPARLRMCGRPEREYWEARLKDMWERWDVWTDLRAAWQAGDAGRRRYWLDKLRFKLGDEAYEAGAMPAALPVAEMWRIDP